MAPSSIVIVSKRQKKSRDALEKEGYIIVDVTSTSDIDTFRKFSPFYPHGGIPVPGMKDATAASVEGVWQGLKVFEKEGIDMKKFTITNMRNIKRAVGAKRGRVMGHMYGEDIIGYVDARKSIYVPAYNYVLRNHLKNELALLTGMISEGKKLALIDFDTNEDLENTAKPLAHASLVKKALLAHTTE